MNSSVEVIEEKSIEAATPRLGEMLLADQKLSRNDLERALEVQRSMGGRLGRLLISLGLVSEGDVYAALSRQSGVPLVRRDAFPKDKPETTLLNASFLLANNLLPMGGANDETSAPIFLSVDPGSAQLHNALRLVFGNLPQIYFGLETEISGQLNEWYVQDASQDEDSGGDQFEASEFIEHLRDMASEAPIIQRVSQIMSQAVAAQASDIHIETYEEKSVVRIRVDGELFPIDELDNKDAPAIVSRIKILSQLDIAERRMPQDGRTKLRVHGKEMDARVSTIPTMFGESVVMRLLEKNFKSRLLVLSPHASPARMERPEALVIRSRTTLDMASNPMSLSALREFKQQRDWADIVHYQFPWPFGDLLHLLHGRKKPSVVSYQSDIVRQKNLMRLYRPLMRHFLASVGRVCATSPSYRDTSPVLSGLRKHIDIIPNGLDSDMCPSAPYSVLEKWRARLGEGFLLFVGVLRYYKGLHTLVEAAIGLHAPVVIAGAGPERMALEALAQKQGASNVLFLGHVSDEDKSALLQLAGVFVFPSHLRSEAFGMSLVEASMYSKPMISCEIGTGTSYVNLHGVTGLTVPPESPAALKAAMQKLLHDPEQAHAMGAAARQRYEERFTGQRMAAAYLQVYQELLGI